MRPYDDAAVRRLCEALWPFACTALPPGVEASIGTEWIAAWREKAQAALVAVGYTKAGVP